MTLQVSILNQPGCEPIVEQLAEQLSLTIISDIQQNPNDMLLHFCSRSATNQLPPALALSIVSQPQWQPFFLDFTSGAMNWRREHGGGELLVRAIQGRKKDALTVLDATAGLGRDSFILASHGFRVQMFERNGFVSALLSDALERARLFDNTELNEVLLNMSLMTGDVKLAMQTRLDDPSSVKPDVIYLDPMFPESKNSALVKKDMQIFHQLVGSDEDADDLLEPARQLAVRRVVVKRPLKAAFLADKKPDYQLSGKAIRFDMYLPV